MKENSKFLIKQINNTLIKCKIIIYSIKIKKKKLNVYKFFKLVFD